MSIHLETLKTRSFTALIFATVMLTGLLVNGYTYLALFSIIMLGCVYEFSKIARLINGDKYFYFLPLAFGYIILPLMLLIDLGMNGLFYLHQSVVSENAIDSYSPILPCAIIFSIWINDTMAYIVGSLIGKTPFSSISPKKTWEGTIGGVILCVVAIYFLATSIAYTKTIHWNHWVMIAAICGVAGTIGDLFESKLKRLANIKDSGSFMPGHGGFLDRFDSLLMATPFVWLYIKLNF